MKKLILILLIPLLSFSQIGINTKAPTSTLEVNGNLKIRASIGAINDTILVIRNNEVLKVPASYYTTMQDACPLFKRSQSSGYYLLFESISSISNPNNSIKVNEQTFTNAGAWIENNKYYYSYTNVSGTAVNINGLLTVKFSSQICTYSNEN